MAHKPAQQDTPAASQGAFKHTVQRRVCKALLKHSIRHAGQCVVHRRLRECNVKHQPAHADIMATGQCTEGGGVNVQQVGPLVRLPPRTSCMVHHRPTLHPPILQPYSKLHQGRPEPALQPLRPRGIHQRAVPQPRRHLVQRNVLHTVHHEPRLLPRRARTVQLLHGPHCTGQTGAAKAVVGRNDA